MTLRITGGEHRGRRFRLPRGSDLRPTSDRVRGAIFSILGVDAVQGVRALDLYAGSGALGLEALSRGAASVDFVEADARRCSHIRDALSAMELSERGRVHNGRVERIVDSLQGGYGLVFADPPYALDDWQRVMTALTRPGMLSDEGLVVAEHRHDTAMADGFGRLSLLTRRRYGDTAISIYETAESCRSREACPCEGGEREPDMPRGGAPRRQECRNDEELG